MSFEFGRPIYLVLLLVLAPVVWSSLKSRVDLPPWRLWSATALRCLSIVCLVLALAGLKKSLPADRMTVLFLVDRSLSVGSQGLPWTEEYVDRARQVMGKNDRFGVLVFGEQTSLELGPAHHQRVSRFTAQVERGGSDLATAIRFACANFPADAARRIVLVSDGNETTGQAAREAEMAAGLGVEVWTVAMPAATGAEFLVEEVEVPGRPAVDSPYDVKVTLAASRAAQGQLTLRRNGQVIARQKVSLEEGRNVYLVPQRAPEPGVYAYTASLEVEADTNASNNKAEGIAMVEGPRQLLYVHGGASAPGPIPDLLRASGLRVKVVSAGELPGDLPGWQAYQAVVFDNVSAFEVSPRQLEWIAALTRELGVGFAMLGGGDSYGVGGYLNTPVAEVLPVELDIRKKKKTALVSLAMAIDKSGSMGAGEGGVDNMALAREGAIAAASVLTEYDQVGVVGFDSAAKWVVPMGPAKNKKAIAAKIGSLRAGGGTDLFPAFRQCLAALDKTNTPLKHLIVLSDGAVAPADYDSLLRQCVEKKITVSAVAVGQGADVKFLSELAQKGGGRAYYTDSGHTLPRIFTRDTVIAARAAFSEKPFRAEVVDTHPILAGFHASTAPALGGYNLTSERGAPAQLLLAGPKGDPLLAVGRHGLGKTVAWTSDNGTRWAHPWAGWPDFAVLLTQSLRYLLPDAESGGLQARLERGDGGRVALSASLPSAGEGDVVARLIAPDGTTSEVHLDQTAPTRFLGDFRPDQPGNWIVHLADRSSGKTLTRVWNVPYSPEHRRLGTDTRRLQAIATAGQGKFDARPEEVFAPPAHPTRLGQPVWSSLVLCALLCLPLEVAIRRVFLPRRERKEKPAPVESQPRVSTVAALKQVKQSPPARKHLPKLIVPTASAIQKPESTPAVEGGSHLDRLKKAKKRAHEQDD